MVKTILSPTGLPRSDVASLGNKRSIRLEGDPSLLYLPVILVLVLVLVPAPLLHLVNSMSCPIGSFRCIYFLAIRVPVLETTGKITPPYMSMCSQLGMLLSDQEEQYEYKEAQHRGM